ncbi:something about silencing protein 10-like isoform X2 [Littorina saxatilis]|uniref:something about silencing protein 10-like isoform X2 n=1 Tax=Littorina saxatilis TaxID=31220 RepID=UPI0038B64A75
MPKRGSNQPRGDESESDQYDDEISTFHKDREKILLDSDQAQSSGSEEVDLFPIDDDDSDDDDEEIAGFKQQLRQLRRNKFKKNMDSDLEEEEEKEEEVPETTAWGSKRSWYMGGDVRDNKIILSGSEDEATAGTAALEEKEAMEIQKRHTALMSEEDFMIPKSTKKKSKPEKNRKKKQTLAEEDSDEENEIQGLVRSGRDELEKIETDFSKLSKKEEQEIMRKMHPEYIPLLNDFNSKCRELQDRILPLMRLVKDDKVQGLGAEYVRMKYHIITNYLSNGAFYMYLVAKRAKGIHEHPVIKRLVQFQNLYKRLLPVDERVKGDMDKLLERVKNGEDVGIVTSEGGADVTNKKRKLAKKMKEGAREKKRKVAAMEEAESGEDEQVAAQSGEENMDEEERRAITYQMEKNKGLTAHKKKEARNPRVKHRMKFRRAKIRRKGQVRDFKAHKNLYTGEVTGIRSGIIRSRKLK